MIKNLISILLVLSISFANFSVALVYAQETETSPEVTESPAPAIIETGDANSNVTIENEVNTNVVTETPEEAAEETPAEEETTTEEPVILPEEEVVTEETTEDPGNGVQTQIENESIADVANTGTSTAETGENTTDNNETPAVISTGDANASMDVINTVNTNIVDSNGMISIMNIFSALFGNLDLSGAFSSPESAPCPDTCNILSEDLTVSNVNVATITNDMVVRAFTGLNSASGINGGTILTGDANAAGNAFNLANTNIIGSNYLLLVMNNFSDWVGNLILPSKYSFGQCCPASNSTTQILNDNTANVENNASAEAESGENTADGGTSEDGDGGAGGVIMTGKLDGDGKWFNAFQRSRKPSFEHFGKWRDDNRNQQQFRGHKK